MSRSSASFTGSTPAAARWPERWRAIFLGLPAWPFFLGIMLGFGACVMAGRSVSRRPMLENFTRFFGPIQLQQQFYATPSQLVAHIRHTVPRDRTLVLVGGASYFRGTGQNPGELWTLELQRQLGSRYAVVNFAADRARLTSFAAVVFAILAREYPSMLYVADGSAHSTPAADGDEDYRYFFWDAYYKGLLPPSVAGATEIARLRQRQLRDDAGRELHLGKWIDHLAYACDLWTWIGYQHVFTVWTDARRDAPFAPRRLVREHDEANLAIMQANTRRDAAYARHNEAFARAASKERFMRTTDGAWVPDEAAWARFQQELDLLFPAELRARILVVLLRGNPFFMQALSAEEHRRTETIYRLGQQAYEAQGYRVVPLGKEELEPDDFLDGGHLMASGGDKVARAVARRIHELDPRPAPPPSGPVDLRLTLPADTAPRRETLLALAQPRGAERLTLEYLAGGRIRFAYSADGAAHEVFSPPITAAPGSPLALTASLGGLYPADVAATGSRLTTAELHAFQRWFLLRVGGQPFWEVPIGNPLAPGGELRIGRDFDGGEAAFSGNIESAARRPFPSSRPARDQIGGVRLRLNVSDAMKNRAFPLLTTGRAGAGDVIFVRVGATGDVIFGHDHWGTPPQLSPAVPWGAGRTHTVEVLLPSATAQEVAVTIDGTTVWRAAVECFPFGSAHVYPGQNPIGSTLAEPALVGAVFEGVLTPAWRD